MAKQIIAQLKEGKVVRGWLGVMIQKITPDLQTKLNLKDANGALVADVTSGGPAEKAGIKRGDVIVSFNGKNIHEMKELPYIVASTPIGATVPVVAIRTGQSRVFEVEIGELKEEEKGFEDSSAKQRFGMKVEKITPQLTKELGLSETTGILITQVDNNSPAAEAGLKPGDIILEIDQAPARNLDDFLEKTKNYHKGDTILFLIKRGNSTLYLTLKVDE